MTNYSSARPVTLSVCTHVNKFPFEIEWLFTFAIVLLLCSTLAHCLHDVDDKEKALAVGLIISRRIRVEANTENRPVGEVEVMMFI